MIRHLQQAGTCPVATTMELLSSKWKILIMRELLKGTQRNNELKKHIGGISQKMLTQSLREMEADKLIIRHVYPQVPPKVEYSLSDLGESMRPIVEAMQKWGTNYLENLDPDYLEQRFGVKRPAGVAN